MMTARARQKRWTRDYVLELDSNGAPLLSIFGGKITTSRHLAEEALAKLGHGGRKSRGVPFPGGDMVRFKTFLTDVRNRYPFLGEAQSLRMARAYGMMLLDLIGEATGMGEDFGGGLTAREVDWMVAREWARTADDVLWRRSKLGLHIDDAAKARVAAYLESKHGEVSAGDRSGDDVRRGRSCSIAPASRSALHRKSSRSIIRIQAGLNTMPRISGRRRYA